VASAASRILAVFMANLPLFLGASLRRIRTYCNYPARILKRPVVHLQQHAKRAERHGRSALFRSGNDA